MNFDRFLLMLQELEKRILALNTERDGDGLPPLEHFTITVLGQMSLLFDRELCRALPLVSTLDLDALLHGDWSVRTQFKELLRLNGLVYDELSEEIWIPPDAIYDEIYSSDYLTCRKMSTLDTLVSKAVKAPAKNRILIREALALYGTELADRVESAGGNLEDFE